MTITIEQLIDRDILANASQMIQALNEATAHEGAPIWIDDLLECCMAPDWSEAPDGYDVEWREELNAYYVSGPDDQNDGPFDTPEEANQAAWDDAGDEPDQIEALQHWIVTDWLAEKLEEVGALVAHDILGFAIWGRTECGQSLTMDSDLQKVIKLLGE